MSDAQRYIADILATMDVVSGFVSGMSREAYEADAGRSTPCATGSWSSVRPRSGSRTT